MNRPTRHTLWIAAALFASVALSATRATAPVAAMDRIFEINITNDLDVSSGEPQIAIDPTDPRNLAIIETAYGSKQVPAWSMNPVLDKKTPEQRHTASMHNGRLQLSTDGGSTWKVREAPAFDPSILPHKGGGDAMIAIGPDGTIYAADCTGGQPKDQKAPMVLESMSLHDVNMFIAASTDGGKTFTSPQPIGTPRDRPWLKVDQTTGTVYTASTGPYNPKTLDYNVPGPDAPFDRWLTAWKPHLSGHSEARRMGGVDFSADRGSTMTAVHGVLAAAFFIDGPQSRNRASVVVPIPSAMRVAVPVPASLQPLVKDGTTQCGPEDPCLFFQTSNDEGLTWKRHHVPVPGGMAGYWSNVAADPGRPGRYAVSVTNRSGTGMIVLVTDNSGETWSAPNGIPESVQGKVFKPWMDYGPTGVLGVMWKKERADLSTPAPGAQRIGQTWGAAFDVYAAISCDGGAHWLPPARVNAESSPSGPNGFDDLSYIALDARYAHLVWGDRRNITRVKNAPTGIGGVQTYYGRVPFSVVAQGAPCGRN